RSSSARASAFALAVPEAVVAEAVVDSIAGATGAGGEVAGAAVVESTRAESAGVCAVATDARPASMQKHAIAARIGTGMVIGGDAGFKRGPVPCDARDDEFSTA